jgi:hypothetical protein
MHFIHALDASNEMLILHVYRKLALTWQLTLMYEHHTKNANVLSISTSSTSITATNKAMLNAMVIHKKGKITSSAMDQGNHHHINTQLLVITYIYHTRCSWH